MGYVSRLICAVIFSAVVFERSIFLAQHILPLTQDAPSEVKKPLVEVSVVESSPPSAVPHPLQASQPPHPLKEITVAAVEDKEGHSLLSHVLVSPVIGGRLPHESSFVEAAFHPPLLNDFWSVFLHQRNYIRPTVQSAPLDGDAVLRLSTGSPVEGVKTPDEEMPSFEEWRQRRLQDVEKEKTDQQAGSTNTGQKRRQRPLKNTNYASVICGAKVTAHNPEVENPNAILTSNRDDYMLNPCKVPRKYFVVELCESVHVHGFDIGNLELFSNVPKTIQVFGSGRFPSREWTDFGRFEMTETRTMQNFSVPSATGFVKFVRVEMLEHYGKEHYCPITVFRVFGTSMVEEYVDSVDDDEAADESSGQFEGGSAGVGEDADMERDKWGQGLMERNVNPITMAKDLVVSFMKKAASSGYNLINGAGGQNSTPAPCRNTTAVISSLRTNGSESQNGTHASGDIAPSSPLLSLCFDNVDGWDVATVTCQYVWCLFQASNASLSFCPGSGNASKIVACDPQPEEIVDSVVAETSTRSVPAAHETVVENVSVIEEVVHPVKLPVEEELATASTDPKAAKFIMANEKEQQKDSLNTVVPVVEKEKEKGSGGESGHLPVLDKPPSVAVNVTETTAVPVPSITNGVPGQKESVFVRLGNRLKTLELNMSLSGQYLHELSRRFKKQGEDSAKNFTVMFGKLMDLSRTETDLYTTLLGRLRELEVRNELLESQTVSIKRELSILRWIVPVLCILSVLFVLISVAAGLYWLPRYIRGLVLMEAQRQHAHGQTNGHAKVSQPLTDHPADSLEAGTAPLIKKRHKKQKKHLGLMEDHHNLTPLRLVPA